MLSFATIKYSQNQICLFSSSMCRTRHLCWRDLMLYMCSTYWRNLPCSEILSFLGVYFLSIWKKSNIELNLLRMLEFLQPCVLTLADLVGRDFPGLGWLSLYPALIILSCRWLQKQPHLSAQCFPFPLVYWRQWVCGWNRWCLSVCCLMWCDVSKWNLQKIY